MKLSKLIFKNIQYNVKNYIAYLVGTSFIVSILFMFFNFINSDIFIEESKELFKGAEVTSLTAIMCIFPIAFIIYTTVTFTKTRGKELGVYYTIGLTSNEILKILFYENTIISVTAFFIGSFSGSLFSKLFNMAFLKAMHLDNININLNINGFCAAGCIAIGVLLINSLYQYFFLKSYSVVEILKSDSKKEIGKAVFIKGFIGVFAFTIAVSAYYDLLIEQTYAGNEPIIFVVVSMVSLYFVVGFAMALIANFFKLFKKFYNNNILVIKSLTHKFLSYRGTIYISLILISVGIMFIIQGFILYKLGDKWIDDIFKYDLSFIVNEKQLQENDFKEIIEKAGGKIDYYKELENLEEEYIKLNWSNNGYDLGFIRIISNELYNKNSKYNRSLNINEVIVPIRGENDIEGNITLKLIDNGKTINREYAKNSFLDIDSYKKYNNDSKYIDFDERNITFEEMYISNPIYECYSDSRPGFLVINDELYKEIKSEIDDQYIYYDILVNLRNDKDYKSIKSNLQEELQKIGGNELKDTLGIKIEYKYIEVSKSGFAFFTLFFLGIMFLFGSGVILYFKIFTSLDEDRKIKDNLLRLGLTKKEVTKILSKEISIIFITPFFIGVAMALIILTGVYNQIDDAEYAKSFMNCILIIYIIVYLIIYNISKKGYLKKALNK